MFVRHHLPVLVDYGGSPYRGSRPHVYRVTGYGDQGTCGSGLQVHEGHYRYRRMKDGLAHTVGGIYCPAVSIQMQDDVVRTFGLRVLQS